MVWSEALDAEPVPIASAKKCGAARKLPATLEGRFAGELEAKLVIEEEGEGALPTASLIRRLHCAGRLD